MPIISLVAGLIECHLEFLDIGVHDLKFERSRRQPPQHQVEIPGHIQQGIDTIEKRRGCPFDIPGREGVGIGKFR